MLRHVRVKRLSEHAQGYNAAIHPWLPELLAQVCANEWQCPLDHGLPAGCLNRSKGCALCVSLRSLSRRHPDILSEDAFVFYDSLRKLKESIQHGSSFPSSFASLQKRKHS